MNKLKLLLITFLSVFLLNITNSQNCYEVIADMSGIDISSYQAELEAAACELVEAFPEEFQNQFKVYDYGFFRMNEFMQGGFQTVWDKVIDDIPTPYYLVFGKQSDQTGIYTKFWVDLKLPDGNFFLCINQLSPNLRENLKIKYQIVANEIHEYNGKNPFQYLKAEIAVMRQLQEYINELNNCCDYQNRSYSNCRACVLNTSQYNRFLDENQVLGVAVDKIIDNTAFIVHEEEIGYEIEISGSLINVDDIMSMFKQKIQLYYPSLSIKIYPCNYSNSCTDFSEILNKFMTEDVDIGILAGVVGVDGESGLLRWQMISSDDNQPEPTTYDSDTCYFFNQEKEFIYKEFCRGDITPRGVLKNYDGFPFDIEFRFSDPEITPRTLTSSNVKGSLDQFLTYGITEEPLTNKAIMMTKDMIQARLSMVVQNKSGAFDYHFNSPWSLLQESTGWDGPFDYSTKNWLQDRKNFIFITDPLVGSDIVGHNFRNMGNFLWGAATYIMGVPQPIALSGAHLNNLINEEDFSLDSPDDQYAIKLGRYYAKIMKWKTLYAGKNNIFRK